MATLKQSTAYNRSFLLVESADHITGLTGASPSVYLSKNVGAFGSAITATVHELLYGWYYIALTSGNTDTLGDLAFHITAASADPTDFVDQVTANILGDTLPASISGTVNANIKSVNGVTVTGSGSGASPWGPAV